jgi:response regulator RpfG family c-di-GMP phosphodiesterase
MPIWLQAGDNTACHSIENYEKQYMEEKQTVLIVDDEPALLLVWHAMIRRQGYNVITALNGVRIWAKENPPI